ncbi:unnamed protein product [Mycena citricolor]|uniref:Rab-GAP TBC domain-containing protein n=1 Tax=Mycena citricolor TaxID=2018698 RepID=A0AAD2HQT9_9AGAR|nr:unnamed protein product [Mycena citricolor]
MHVAGRAMDAAELARWTRFAAKGGIGRCTATGDCVAEGAEDLMFLKNDEIVVLMQLPEENVFLGYCEGIVGRFNGDHVRFHSKLKKPVMTKRSSVPASGKATPTPSISAARSPTPSTSFSHGFSHSTGSSPRSPAYTSTPPSPQSQPPLKYQPDTDRAFSEDAVPASTSFSSMAVSASHSESTATSLSSSLSSISSAAVPDTPATVYSPTSDHEDPTYPMPLKSIDTSVSGLSMETNISARSSTQVVSVASSVDDGEGEDEKDDLPSGGRNRRSETTTVEMWPVSSPSSALSRKPINSSRLALAIGPPEEGEGEEEEEDHARPASSSSDSGQEVDYAGPNWTHLGGTLPLQVVKLNSAGSVPPSPFQPLYSPLPRAPVTDEPMHFEESDSASEYGSEDQNDETRRFSSLSEPEPEPELDVHEHRESKHELEEAADDARSARGSRLYAASVNDEEDSSRLSVVAPSLHGSEDGEVGIGLSLLQGLVDDDMGDDSSDEDDEKRASFAPTKSNTGSPSRRQSDMSNASRTVPRTSEDWDGGSIYDDYYRFSRFSTNPRSSTSTFASGKMSRRFSQSSHRAPSNLNHTIVPPVPQPEITTQTRESEAEHDQAPSVAEVIDAVSDSDASVYTQESRSSSPQQSNSAEDTLLGHASADDRVLRIPAQLELNKGEPSPLLHTRWGSPVSSESPPTSSAPGQSSFFVSSPSGSAASPIGRALELEPASPTQLRKSPEDELANDPVVEDDVDNDEDVTVSKPDAPAPLVIEDALSPPSQANSSMWINSPLSPLPASSPEAISSPETSTPPASQVPSPQSHHRPRPSLSELRGYDAAAPGPRTSLFLPHPNAPKAPPTATGAPEGPMYIRTPPLPQQQPPPAGENVNNVIRMSIGRSTVTRIMPTIYGRTDIDLSSSTGPVRIVFTIDPPPPLPSQLPFRNGVVPPSVSAPPQVRAPPHSRPQPIKAASSPPLTSPNVPPSSLPLLAVDKPAVLSRPNFTPRAGTARPRSRSFSGFDSSSAPPPGLPEVEKGPHKTSLSISSAPSSGASAQPAPSPSLGKHGSRSSLRSSHAPSPLSLPHNNTLFGGMRPPGSPLSGSPLAQKPPPPPPPPSSVPKSAASVVVEPNNDRPSLDQTEQGTMSPGLGRDSLRNKLSLPNLRRNPTRQNSSDSRSELDTMQVQDMDFELIRPNLAQLQLGSGRSSEDSSLGRDAGPSFDGRTSALSEAYRRTDSPAMSFSSSSQTASTEASVDAHRQRELKWVALMGTVLPAQAKKSKKIKKLLTEGAVPSSVRFLVWSHLTDGKGKAIPGVYAQLGKRARPAALAGVERDVARCSIEHPQVQAHQLAVVSLLQAYLTMEDAFWIFVSIMDSYIRPYFSVNTTQLEVDASLLAKTLEANDPQVAKKLLVDMGVNPVDLCRPWFTTLFVDILPLEYLNRVWDLFLFEGIPFLFRVCLALFQCTRRRLLESINQDALMNILRNPIPPTWLPANPDAFISLTLSVKLKDDDIRKQRVKLEALVKRQTQQAPRSSGSRSVSGPSRI